MLSFLARTWFPLALIALFLAVIPGVALVILAMVQMDGAVNSWLQNHLQISYQLALSPWLVLVMLFIPPAILILYFLKLKRKALQVPSTFLWKKSIEDLHVNSLLQWLRQNVLLVLQLLTLLFMIYALLGLRYHGASGEGRHYILLIDNSASMAATDVKPSRLAVAKDEALKVIDAASDNDYGMVIEFNAKATTRQAYTNNRIRLREAVNAIEQTHRLTRLEEALSLIDGLANPVRSTEDIASRPKNEVPGQERSMVPELPKGIETSVHFFSDGRYAPIAKATLDNLSSKQTGGSKLLGNLQVLYHPLGKIDPGNANNLGIVGMQAVRMGAAGTDQEQEVEVKVSVQNFSRKSVQITLRLEVKVDGTVVDSPDQTLNLAPRSFQPGDPAAGQADEDIPGEASDNDAGVFHVKNVPPQSNVVLKAYLVQPNDDFALDDEAWCVLSSVRKAKVLIVGPYNPVLTAFFNQEATQKLVDAQQLAPEDLATDKYRTPARNGEVDLVIFDRCAPAEEADMPQANTFFIDQPPPPWRRGDKTLDNQFLIVSKTSHPLLRHITSLWDVGIARAFSFDLSGNLDDKAKPLFFPDKEDKKDTGRRSLPALTRLAESSGAVPLIFTLHREPFKDLVLAFALVSEKGDLNTDWPLRPSFPLFLFNVINNLGNRGDAERSPTVQPGEPMLLRPEAGVQRLTITAPNGKAEPCERNARGEFLFAKTDRLGAYDVLRPDGLHSSFAVNLLDSNESTIDPRPEVVLGQSSIEAGKSEVYQPRELWKWILIIGLILLVAEWFLYNQRVSI